MQYKQHKNIISLVGPKFTGTHLRRADDLSYLTDVPQKYIKEKHMKYVSTRQQYTGLNSATEDMLALTCCQDHILSEDPHRKYMVCMLGNII